MRTELRLKHPDFPISYELLVEWSSSRGIRAGFNDPGEGVQVHVSKVLCQSVTTWTSKKNSVTARPSDNEAMGERVIGADVLEQLGEEIHEMLAKELASV